MTRKDLEVLAACLGQAYKAAGSERGPGTRTSGVADVHYRIVNELELMKPRFNRSAFKARVDYWLEEGSGR